MDWMTGAGVAEVGYKVCEEEECGVGLGEEGGEEYGAWVP